MIPTYLQSLYANLFLLIASSDFFRCSSKSIDNSPLVYLMAASVNALTSVCLSLLMLSIYDFFLSAISSAFCSATFNWECTSSNFSFKVAN